MGIFTALPFLFAILWILPVFPLLYVLIRWRAAGHGEPGIGSYSLVLHFRCAAVLVAVGALAVLTYRLFSVVKGGEDVTRTAWGTLLAAVVFLAIQVPMGAALQPKTDTAVASRTFGGFLLAIAGTIVFAALLWFCVTLLEKVSDYSMKGHKDMLKMSGSLLVWYAALYCFTAVGMRR